MPKTYTLYYDAKRGKFVAEFNLMRKKLIFLGQCENYRINKESAKGKIQ